MISSLFILALGALPMALADQHYYGAGNATSSHAPSPTGTPSESVQIVSVGQNGLRFTPDTIHAVVGQNITFQFFPKNHSVVQANFDNPCNPSEGGIFSGFIPSAAGPANQTFTIQVKDKQPIWLYCAALLPTPHCAQGMVAVINPPADGPNTLDAFRAAANRTSTSTAPSTPPSGGEVQSGVPSGSPSPSGTAPGAPDGTGAASALVVSSGAVGGLVAMFAALLL
ncbi:hypothetical protein BS50DRAFT_405111 [Corynespora cassiicola Philippines]|uniref:Cupredoxin n=1 Tax=Corynespora cassiicola Philippines TaxID=1448308 RepID=A0A2T2NKU2_CORCC|nr:hypothetical protein BS50DRAFT_405111 [Corynespora cassiicola Philippines]